MDHLPLYEASDIVKNLLYVDKNDRELKRYQLYVTIQSNSKNKIKLEDVFSLPWDKHEEKKEWNEEMEKAMEAMQQKENMMLNLLNSGKMKMEQVGL